MRARKLKPTIFKNEFLARLPSDCFRLFTGLWCLADRKGRLENNPKRIEAELFPFKSQAVQIGSILSQLEDGPDPFISCYEINGKGYIQILNFEKHQSPHVREPESVIPNPPSQPVKKEPSVKIKKPRAVRVPKKQKELPIDFWKELVAHMDRTWFVKRKAKFFWKAQHFKHLRSMAKLYQPWGVMALWDAFLGMNDDWVRATGYSFEAFAAKIPKLVDDSFWKMGAKSYEEELNGPMPDVGNILKTEVSKS